MYKTISNIQKLNPETLEVITFRLDTTDSNFGYYYWRFPNLDKSYDTIADFSAMMGVQFLPSILIFNRSGKLVSRNGFQDILDKQ